MSNYYNRIHDEKVRAAWISLRCLELELKESIYRDVYEKISAVLPPLPEPERPKITPARELVVNILHQTQGRGLTTPAADLEWGIKAARAEIIVLLEWELQRNNAPLDVARRLLVELREADA